MLLERGVDYQAMLEQVGLGFDPMDENAPGYRERVTMMEYSALYRHVLFHLQDQTFGLKIERGFMPGAFRMLCYSIIHCENLGKALRRTIDFLDLFMPALLRFRLDREPGQAVVRMLMPGTMDVSSVLGPGEVYNISMWHRFFGWLIGRPIVLTEVRLRATECSQPGKYERFFGCPLVYGQEHDALVFDDGYLDAKLVHTEDSLREFLRTSPYQLMTLTPEHDEGRLLNQVRRMVGHDYSHGFPSFEEIASNLNMSAPTLRRRLKREGTTYQQLKDELRKDAAIHYLFRPDLSINDVAALMGFTDPSAFHRSFKKWTGVPPGTFRTREQASRGDSGSAV